MRFWTITKRGVLRTVLGVAVAWSAGSTAPAIAADCGQPADSGCPIDLSQPVTAVLANASDVHTWRLRLRSAGPLHIVLTNLPADYDLHVYAGDGSLLGESTNEGIQDDVVDLADADVGTYMIYVNSPLGDVSDQPYTLLARGSNGESAAAQPATPVANNAPATRPAPGQILLADNFDDPKTGWLPTGPSGGGTLNYLGGEYQLLKTDPISKINPTAFVPGVFTDSSIAFDARFVDLQPGVGLFVRCRSSGYRSYRADILPANRTVALGRQDGDPSGRVTYLVPSQPTSLLLPSVSTYHVQLTCVGPVISLAINNIPLLSAEDATYSSGNHVISAGNPGIISDVRLGNLVVTQR